MGESVSEMKLVNLRPYISAVEAAALDLQKELQEKAMSLITPSPETDRYSTLCYGTVTLNSQTLFSVLIITH